MLGTIYKFELEYHLRRPVTYLYVFVFLLLSFLFTGTDIVRMVGANAQVKVNSPAVLAQLQLLVVLVGQMILTALVGTSVLRDYQVGAHELLFTTPISRGAYLGGRFLGVLTVMLLLHLAVPVGAWLGTVMPWVDHEKLLPFSAASYLHPFITLVVPSVMLTTAIFFGVGALSRNLFVIYTQGMALLVLYNISGSITANLENRQLASLLDPFGLSTVAEVTRYWTVAEQNSRLIPLAGDILWNRLLWSAVAIGTSRSPSRCSVSEPAPTLT
jgi:ABC-type transport system involved in multi-copper enzyme maturation permease subunit